ncbi:MAG: sugar ABC transporter permease [Acidimicrobiia bacterium]|nr:sugar ABC transporter permease [Acidimicrobiia bacterium]
MTSTPSRSMTTARRRSLTSLVLTLPAWLMIVVLIMVPIAVGFYLSLRNERIGGFVPPQYVGFENYRSEIANKVFWEAALTTVKIMIIGLVIQLPIGVGLALLLHQSLRGTRLFRSVLLIPMLLTPVAVGLMWRFMYDGDLGVINWLLETVGLGRIQWLGDDLAALFAVVLVDSWQSIPFVMLLTLAGLAGMSTSPLEAAKVDGAGPWQLFWYVILPMLRPVLGVILIIRIIDTYKLFDAIFILTRGGPGTATQTLGILNYNTGFNFLATSRAAAIGIALTAITIPLYFLWAQAARIEP